MEYDPEKVTAFAKTDARGQHVTFGIKAKDRQRHMYVIGKTGMGKSTLLENMAAQDIKNGEGMAFIDPHGSAAETLLHYIPEERINDVVYFAPFDMENPIAFNVMEDVGPERRHLVVSGLMSTFKKIWVDAWSARMEYILTNALLALLEYPDSTLLSVNRMLSDKHYRDKVIDNVKDPAVKAYWVEEFGSYTERFAAEALPAIQNKIGQFTGNPLIRNIIGQPKSSFDIRDIMDNRKILIINLSKGLVGETNANLLGSMLTTRIYLAAMSRANLSPEVMKTMPNFYFYVDEFQSFANATFANILSEARKYHLNLIIAHQYIEQMEEEVRDAVFGNVGTTVAFRVGPFDAEVLEPVYTPTFLAPDLVNLGFAQIYLTLMIDGIGSPPFSATTLPPIETPAVSLKEKVIEASRKNFTGDQKTVEKLIEDMHKPTEKPTKPNNQNYQKDGSRSQNRNNDFKQNDRKPVFDNRNKKPQLSPKEVMQKENSLQKDAAQKNRLPQNNARTEQSLPSSKNQPQGERYQQRENRPDTRKPQQSSEGLKDALKAMINKEGSGAKPKKHHEDRNTQPLKDALASVVKQTTQNVPTETEKQPEQTKQQFTQQQKPRQEHSPQEQYQQKSEPRPAPVQSKVQQNQQKPESKPAQIPQPQHNSSPAPTEPRETEEQKGTSPKELERMMRVTTSDKPPI